MSTGLLTEEQMEQHPMVQHAREVAALDAWVSKSFEHIAFIVRWMEAAEQIILETQRRNVALEKRVAELEKRPYVDAGEIGKAVGKQLAKTLGDKPAPPLQLPPPPVVPPVRRRRIRQDYSGDWIVEEVAGELEPADPAGQEAR